MVRVSPAQPVVLLHWRSEGNFAYNQPNRPIYEPAAGYLLMRNFNRESADEVNENRKKEGKKKIARVEGRKRVEMFSKHCDRFNESTD